MGRTSKTAAVKSLSGNAGKRRPRNASAAAPPKKPATPIPPGMLDPIAIAHWQRLYPELSSIAIMAGGIFDDLLAQYCEQHALYDQAKASVAKDGLTYKTVSKHGEMIRENPALKTLERAGRNMRALADRFGLSPLAWARLAGANATAGKQLPLPGLDQVPVAQKAKPANDDANAPQTEEDLARRHFGH